MATWAFDTETLPNRTLFCAKNVETGEWFDIWRHQPGAPEKPHAMCHTFLHLTNL